MEREVKTLLNRIGFAAPAFAALVLVLGTEHSAFAKTAQECSEDLGVCLNIACKNEGNWCLKECETKFMNCGSKSGGKNQQTSGPFSPKTGDRTPPTGGTKGDPKKPPKTGDHTRPTGGTKADPKTPTTGGSGPILLRSSSGTGPSFRSGGGRR